MQLSLRTFADPRDLELRITQILEETTVNLEEGIVELFNCNFYILCIVCQIRSDILHASILNSVRVGKCMYVCRHMYVRACVSICMSGCMCISVYMCACVCVCA